jgi:hypothetical protein
MAHQSIFLISLSSNISSALQLHFKIKALQLSSFNLTNSFTLKMRFSAFASIFLLAISVSAAPVANPEFENGLVARGALTKLIKAFIDDIPDSKLTGFSNSGGTIYKDDDFRLDMQGVSIHTRLYSISR